LIPLLTEIGLIVFALFPPSTIYVEKGRKIFVFVLSFFICYLCRMSFTFPIADHLLFEDAFVLVVHKPHGLMVEPDRNNHPNLLQQVKQYLKTTLPAGKDVYAQHIHRLDRPVAGVVLFAKQRAVLKDLSEQFAERRVKKYYEALTLHAPEQRKDRLEQWHRKEKKKATIVEEGTPWAEKVILEYEIQYLPENKFLWKIELHTGKFHQIRAQLASQGCPIVGDSIYGSEALYKPEAIALRAHRLVFAHPVSREIISIETTKDQLV